MGCADGFTLGADEGDAVGAPVRVGALVTAMGLGVGAISILVLQKSQL